MFARIKKSGKNEYLQIVENKKVAGKVKQRVIATIGRLDQMHDKGRVETLIRSLSKYSEKVLFILSNKSDPTVESKKIGPALVFERLWRELGMKDVIEKLLAGRKYEFNVERAIFLTVLHRLLNSGSDRLCHRWRRDYHIEGIEDLDLHHLYRAMAFLGEELSDQSEATPFGPRCVKDLIEEDLFQRQRDLFSELDLVFFDTTSLYFEGNGGDQLGERGFSKDHRPDLMQMVVGVVIDNQGRPICCEMWPGNTADVKTLVAMAKSLRKRFHITRFCLVADRGMISASTVKDLERSQPPLAYILGTRMRKVKEIKEKVIGRGGRYKTVYYTRQGKKDRHSLMVKEVCLHGTRYIVCVNPRQAKKDAQDRSAIIESLEEQLKKGAKSLVGNKGYRRYVKLEHGSFTIDTEKAKEEKRYDGKWVLQTNTDLPAEETALKYKELWLMERVFRDIKTTFETRPIYHRRDHTIRGHVFCSFLALSLRKELEKRLETHGHVFEWAEIKQDLEALQEVTIEENGKHLAIRSRCLGTCGKIFQSVGVALPPTIRELKYVE